MTDFLVLVVWMLIAIFGVIDLKFKAIPSIFLTGILFVIAFLNPANIWFGMMGLLMAFLLYEGEFFGGIADIKIMAMISLMVNTTNKLILLIGLVLVAGFVWKYSLYRIWKAEGKPLDVEIPFVPVFLFVYTLLIIFGAIKLGILGL